MSTSRTIPFLPFLLLASALCVTGCASVAPDSGVELAATRHSAIAPGPAAAAAGSAQGVPARQWWRALEDESLDALVDEAMSRNHDVRSAVAAVKAARAAATAAERDALPQGRLQLEAQSVRASAIEVDPYRQGLPRPPVVKLGTVVQSLGWELDLFGRVGTAAAIADRAADAAQADLHAAIALLQGDVVRHYALLREQQLAAASLAAELSARQDHAKQMESRVTAGLADRREAYAAQAEVARVKAEHAAAMAATEVQVAALAVLVGRSPTQRDQLPDAILRVAPLPAVPSDDHIVVPDDLLARRPDVARADARLRASIGESALASRAHLPRLSLNLAAGLNAPFGSLGTPGAQFHSAGPVLSWDWLAAGRIQARALAAKAGEEATWHQFEQVVLRALQDSESAMRQWSAAREGATQAQQGEQAAQQAAKYAQARHAAGLEPAVVALDQAATHQHAYRAAIGAQAEAVLAFAQLQLALGAWQPEASGT